MMSQMEGAYTRTQAFNFLKDLLGIPRKKSTISKEFFDLFFDEVDSGFYLLKKPEDFIRELFDKEGIAELNKMYYQKKKEKNREESQEIANTVRNIVAKELAA
ncbi:MAG TPA: hypothetical protein VK153_02475 [Candidatus Paceibacterota bacterium]|nr:hypothetical protein [Candidatus Paceibacterota bacterium]